MMMNQLNTYKKDFMNIKFISDDDLPLGKTFNILDMIIVLEKNDKCYSQIFLQECTYRLWKCYSTKKLIFQKELTLIKQVHQKKCMLCHYWCFKGVWFKFEPDVCNKCQDVLMTTYALKNIAILNV